jgi:hypothetical protein
MGDTTNDGSWKAKWRRRAAQSYDVGNTIATIEVLNSRLSNRDEIEMG